MSVISKVKSWFSRTFGGGSSSRSSSRSRASRVSNYGGGGSRSYRDYSSGGYRSDYEDRQEAERRRRQEQAQKRQATTNALSSISKRTDALSSGRSSSVASSATSTGNGYRAAIRKIEQKTVPPDPKVAAKKASQERATAKLKSIEKKMPTVKSDKARIRSGDYEYAPKAKNINTPSAGDRPSMRITPKGFEKEMQNPAFRKSISASRGFVGKGVSFNVGEALLKGDKNDAYDRAMEEVYQKNKAKGYEIGGELAGSLIGFGKAAGSVKTLGKAVGTKALGKEGFEKATEKAVAHWAAKASTRRAAEKELAKAVEKGSVKVANNAMREQLINEFARNRASRIVSALGADASLNLSAGIVNDVARASNMYEPGSKEWWKEVGISTGMNLGIGYGATVLPNKRILTGFPGKGKLREETLETIGKVKGAYNKLDDIGKASFKDAGRLRPDAIKPPKIGESIETKIARAAKESAESVEQNADDAAKAELPKMRQAMREAFTQGDDAGRRIDMNEALAKNSPFRQADDVARNVEPPRAETPKSRIDVVDEELERIEGEIISKRGKASPEELESLNKQFDDLLAERRAIEEAGNAPRAEVPRTEAPRAEAKPATTAEQVAKDLADDVSEASVDRATQTAANRAEIRATHEGLNASVQEVSGGKYGARKSFVTAADFAGDAETDRMARDIRKVMDDIARGDGLDESLKSDGLYLRNTKAGRDKIAREQTAIALNDPEATISKLRSKLSSGDQITLEDLAQMTAIKNYFKANGIELPADVAQDFSRIYLKPQTERAQLLRSSYLFMAENDAEFKETLIRKDLDAFRKKVCNVSEEEWAEMSKQLEKANGEGWLENEIKRLSEMTGAENRELFEDEYRKLCKDIYRFTEPSFWEVVSLIRHSFMLSNLKTGLNNILGNVSQLEMYRMSDMLQVAFENQIARSAKAQGKEFRRTTAFLKSNELKKLARWSSLNSGAVGERMAKNATETEFEKLFNNEVKKRVADAMGDSKYGLHYEKGSAIRYEGSGKVKGAIIKGAQKYSKGVSYMLNEPDSWFVEKSYRLAFAKYLESNGITTAKQFADNEELIREASDYAFDVALENTYKKANRVVNLLEGARTKGYAKGSTLGQKAIAIGLDAELPYLKVPTNLIINNFKYSPMGLLKGGVDAMTALRHGDIEAMNIACRKLSKGLTGTGMALLGFTLACDDQVGEDDWGFISAAKDYYKEYGVRDNSFKIGDKNLNISNMGIGAVQFLMGARYAEELNEHGGAPSSFLDDFDILTSVFAANFDSIADMSLLDNTFAIFDAVSNKGDYDMKRSEQIGNLALTIGGNYAGQFVPAPVRSFARGITDADLDTNIKKGEGDNATRQIRRSVNNIVSGIPVVNEKVLPHKVDRHGNLVHERNTPGEKLKQVAHNFADPFNTQTVKIPEADKVELSVKTESGKPYQPKGYDENREYKAKIGQGKHAEKLDLTGKEREQVARSFKYSGQDMAHNLVYAKAAWFGDSHGARAQQILKDIPEDEEKAREYLYNTPEFKALDDYDKAKFMDALYDKRLGRGRTANYEAYVNIKGGDEGDFRFQNDLHWRQQDKYESAGLADAGITKGMWADVIEAAKDESHKFKDGQNVDTINSAWKLKNALMNLDMTPEQRVAAYQAIRGKRNGFGWYDWDGVSLKGYRRRGRRRRGWRHYGHGHSSKKAKVPTPKTIKANQFVKGEALGSTTKSSSATKSSAKATPPTLKRVQAKIDLPTVKTTTKKR